MAYIRGSALVNLDLDANGTVFESEIQSSRNYANGDYYTGPRPLSTLIFPTPDSPYAPISGVPQSMKDLLLLPEYAAAAASPAGQAIHNAPSGGSMPTTGQEVPVGFFLKPA